MELFLSPKNLLLFYFYLFFKNIGKMQRATLLLSSTLSSRQEAIQLTISHCTTLPFPPHKLSGNTLQPLAISSKSKRAL